MNNKKQKRREFLAGAILIAITVVFSFVVLFTKNADVVDAIGDISAFDSSVVNTTSISETTLQAITESDIATFAAPEITYEPQEKFDEQATVSVTSMKAEPTRKAFYHLTDDQRNLIERVVMAEAGSEPGAGIIAVANCMYNAMLRCEGDPYAAVIEYGYTNDRKSPSKDVREAVQAVFDRGELVLDDDVLYFCRSDCESALTGWHSTLELVCTIGNHNFYRV